MRNKKRARGGHRDGHVNSRGTNYSYDRSNGNIRAFTKLIKDETATLVDERDASQFLSGMEAHESKFELCTKLTDIGGQGPRRLREVLELVGSVAAVEQILIRLLRTIINEETNKPLYSKVQSRVLRQIYFVQNLMGMLVELEAVTMLSRTSAEVLCSFVTKVTVDLVEARKDTNVWELARQFRERGDIPQARVLNACVLVDIDPGKEDASEKTADALVAGPRALWDNDIRRPGGRHDNDHLNFRDINIIPTKDELDSKEDPWLPLAGGLNDFVDDPVTKIIGNNFRLLREDALSTMRERIGERYRPWNMARIVDLDVTVGRGDITFVVQFESRANVNWNISRSLSHGAVVAFCNEQGEVAIMGTITYREERFRGEWLHCRDGPKIGVTFDAVHVGWALQALAHNALYTTRLKELMEERKDCPRKNQSERAGLSSQIDKIGAGLISFNMIEASSSFFTYKPILQTLQGKLDLPFTEEISGRRVQSDGRKLDYLPSRLRMPNDKYFRSYELNLDSWSTDMVVKSTSLDPSQADALHHTLTNRVALIQGPPGTGKTFIGALISRIIRENTDASILCLCYTNHALDQFLEHMLEAGEQRIVRIGGKSKSEKLNPYQLRTLARNRNSNSSDDTRRVRQLDAQMHRIRDEIKGIMSRLTQPVKWADIKMYLEDEDTFSYYCLTPLRVEAEGDFEIIGPGNRPLKPDFLWRCWCKGEGFPSWLESHIDCQLPTGFREFWQTDKVDRLAIISRWQEQVQEPIRDNLRGLIEELGFLETDKVAARQQQDMNTLNFARVIGATTTGAAMYKDLLSSKKAEVMIVEEAGEVLEAHILSALQADATKHLILIGDHKQLRPKVESYELSTVSGKGYNLDCSLFERLILSKIPHVTLGVQHRMRPEISSFIRMQTYPKLVDHVSVTKFPNLKGATENVVFVDHRLPEDFVDENSNESKSKSNKAEARRCVEIARFFLLQGYSPNQIVILTPYLGQLLHLVNMVRSNLKEATAILGERDTLELFEMDESQQQEDTTTRGAQNLRCSSIDNFQGEEADIIIASLVRSNKRGAIGFLKEEQRVNVLMSRARLGMILVGNSETFRSSHQGTAVWTPILDKMEENQQLLSGLPTYCQLHPDDDPLVLSTPDDFRLYRPNGGCGRKCTFRMDCGHPCSLMCHPYDRQHITVQKSCHQPCKRVPEGCPSGHRCPKLCKEDCGPCQFDMGPFQIPDCGHWKDQAFCFEIHETSSKQRLALSCLAKVLHKFPKCGHEFEISCGSIKQGTPICPGICGKPVDGCGHPCSKLCAECKDGDHVCTKTCERILFCGHRCGRPCHFGTDCPPCEEKCFVRCEHSTCAKKCCVMCASCVEPCSWSCKHEGSCKLVCGAPCSRLPCNMRCEKKLDCGHQCPSLCGEECPDSAFCQECCNDDKKAHKVDMVLFTDYQDHDVDEDPIIVLPCGHFYSMSTLDGYFGMNEVYQEKEPGRGKYSATKPLTSSTISEKPKTCPDCRSRVHSVKRYGRILRLAELRALERKHMSNVEKSFPRLRAAFETNEVTSDILLKRLEKLMTKLNASPMKKVYDACDVKDGVEVPRPPQLHTMQLLQLKGEVYAQSASSKDDVNDKMAKETFQEGLDLADITESIRSGALFRLHLVSCLAKWGIAQNAEKVAALEHIKWIEQLDQSNFADLIEKAAKLKEAVRGRRDEIMSVLKAMSSQSGYNYGTSWSSHWYECPNGHPYFIGECGGAMQRSTCIECGAPVGGTGHTLDSTNRQAGQSGGVFGQAFRSFRN